VDYLYRRFTLRYVFALALIGALLVISYSSFVVYFKSAAADGYLINISGRQRMLSQRIAFLLLANQRASNSIERSELKKSLHQAIDLMERTHESLIGRNLNPEHKDLYFKESMNLDAHVREFVRVSRESTGSNLERSFSIHTIDQLLKNLDRAVMIFEEKDRKHDLFLIRMQTIVLMLGIIALLLMGRFIFKPMMLEIGNKNEELSESNAHLIIERNHVKLLSEVAVIANESKAFDDAMRETMKYVCLYSSWPIGHAYLVDSASEEILLPTNTWFLQDKDKFNALREITERTTLKRGVGLPGRVLECVGPVWVDDVAIDGNFPRNKYALEIGVHSAFAFPIMSKGKVRAVLEFFSEKIISKDDALLRTVIHVGQQLGQVYDREESEKKIVQFNRTLEERVKERTQTIIEQQEKIAGSSKMSALGEMASGIAHEINTPLAAISILSSQLKEVVDDDPIDKELLKGHADKIEKTSSRIAKIIKGLRSFSRDSTSDPFILINATELIEDVFSLCKEKFSSHGVEMNVSFSEESLSFYGQPVQLSQVVVNLLNNSFDAISELKEKWVRLEVKKDAAAIEISITDSGFGVPVHIQDKIFDPFYTTKEIGKGTGIGLSLSKKILQAHKGDLFLNSNCKHTQFILKIPKDLESLQGGAA